MMIYACICVYKTIISTLCSIVFGSFIGICFRLTPTHTEAVLFPQSWCVSFGEISDAKITQDDGGLSFIPFFQVSQVYSFPMLQA